MGTVINFQAKKEEFLKRETERRARAEPRAERVGQLKQLGASYADQVRFSLDTERLLAGGEGWLAGLPSES